MTEELNKPVPPENGSSEPSPESPATPPSPEPAAQSNPFIPNLGVRELSATWEMLVGFKRAILENDHWSGKDVQAVAMGLQMIATMEGQYKIQLDMAKTREKQQQQMAKDAIKAQGGTVGKASPALKTIH